MKILLNFRIAMLMLRGERRPYRNKSQSIATSFRCTALVVPFSFALFFLFASISAQAITLNLSGKVSHNGNNLSGIQIIATTTGTADTATTDVNGDYQLTINTSNNMGTLTVSMVDCENTPQQQQFNYQSSATTFTADYSSFCPQNTVTITGHVSHQGGPMNGKKVWFSNDGFQSFLDSATTDASGNFSISPDVSSVPQGTLTSRMEECDGGWLDQSQPYLVGDQLVFDLEYCAADSFVVSGVIQSGGKPLVGQRARIETYHFDTSTNFLHLVQVDTTKTDGSYKVHLTQPGDYLIKAIAQDNLNQSAAGYGDDKLFWTNTPVTTVGKFQPGTLHVDLAEFPIHSGVGSISGHVFGSIDNDNDPYASAPILLLNTSDQTLVSFALTDEFGKYEFSQLPDGEYEVYLDVPGLPTEAPTIQINLSNPDQVAPALRVNRRGVSYEQFLTTDEKNIQTGTEVYPNPFNENLIIRNLDVSSTVSLLDLTGKVVLQQQLPTGTIQWDTQELLPGMYIIRIENPLGEDTALRVVKSR